jgi:hypothetical protein
MSRLSDNAITAWLQNERSVEREAGGASLTMEECAFLDLRAERDVIRAAEAHDARIRAKGFRDGLERAAQTAKMGCMCGKCDCCYIAAAIRALAGEGETP